MKTQDKDDRELFEKEKPKWEVITLHKRQAKWQIAKKVPKEISRHELLFGGKVETTRTGEGGLAQLQDMAKFMNKHGMVPIRYSGRRDKGPLLPGFEISPEQTSETTQENNNENDR